MSETTVPLKSWGDSVVPSSLPDRMRALRIHRYGALPEWDELPLPQVGPGDVLVKLAASVVSHHDLTVAGGEFAIRPPLPYTPGLEGAGRIAGVGEGVELGGFAIGAPVRVYGGGLGAARPGTWAEYLVAGTGVASPVSDVLSPAIAAACGSVALTAWTAAIDRGGLQIGERIGVTGATGAVGSLVVQLAALHGVKGIVGWVRSPDRARLLPPSIEVIISGGPVEPVDLLVDTVGGPSLADRLSAVRRGGRAVLVGYTAGESACFSLPNLMAADVSLLPLNMMRRRPSRELELSLLEKFVTGQLKVETEVVMAGDAVPAIARLRSGAVSGRLVFAW